MSSRVAVVKITGDIRNSVEEAIRLIGGLKISPGEMVLVKPNVCYTKNTHNMILTDFRVIKAVVEMIKEYTNRILVVETDNISGSAEKRALESGLLELLKELDVEFMNLSGDEVEIHEVAGFRLEIPKTVLEADRIVNLPKMKTSGPTLVTLSLKNLFGLLANRDKKMMHKALDEILPYLGKVIRQDMIVVDGIVAMEGNGPLVGNPVQMNLVVAGVDPVAVDSTCARIMGFNPREVRHVVKAAELGVGSMDAEVVGTPVEEVAKKFLRPYSVKAVFRTFRILPKIYL